MSSLKAVVRDWKVRNVRPPLRKWPALAGDGTGVVSVPNRTHYINARMPDGQVAEAYNASIPVANDDSLWVGYDDVNTTLFQVLGLRAVYGEAGLTPARLGLPLHGDTHRDGSIDTTPIDGGQFTPGLVVPLGTMAVFLPETWYYKTATTIIRYDAQNSDDLTAYIPATAGTALWVNISINPSTNLAVYTVGSAFDVAFTQDQTVFFPTPPSRHIILGDILLRWDTTAIEQIDCRRRSYFIGGGAGGGEEALTREIIWFFS